MEASMRLFSKLVIGPLVLIAALSSAAVAQDRHAVSPAALAAVVNQHVATQDAGRAAIHEALGRPEVRELAHRAGVDLQRIDAAVNTISGTDLDRTAAAAQQVNQALTGGSNITISTTTVIIALLVLILIIVAVN